MRCEAVDKMQSICRCKNAEMTIDDERAKAFRKFIIIEININAEFYQSMVDFDKVNVTKSPATKMIEDEAMQNFETN